MKRPGDWLRACAARACSRQTMERIVDPAIADLQAEHEQALRAGRRDDAARIRIRGYAAFWCAVGLHAVQSAPSSLRHWIAADAGAIARTIWCSLIAFGVVLLLFTASPALHFYSRLQDVSLTLFLVPQAIPISIPISLSLGIVCAGLGDRRPPRAIRRVLPFAVAATLLAFAAMLAVPAANQAFREGLAHELGLRGKTFSLSRGVNELSLAELRARIREYEAYGFSGRARQFTRAYHVRFAIPCATLVLGLVAAGISARVRGLALRVLAILITLGIYWAILAVAERSATLPAALAVWAPNLVVTAVALPLFVTRPDRPQREGCR